MHCNDWFEQSGFEWHTIKLISIWDKPNINDEHNESYSTLNDFLTDQFGPPYITVMDEPKK